MKKVDLKSIIEIDSESNLEKHYFYASPYRKIKYQLILDILTVRLEELFEVCYKKNTNLKNLKSNDKVYFYVEQFEFFKNILYVLEKNKLATSQCIFNNNTEHGLFSAVTGACEIIAKGWDKEAIPVVSKKKSFISGFFSKLFS